MIYEIHEYKESDVPWLRSLWLEAFGDEPSLTDTFFELLPSMGVGLVAEFYGELFGAAYVLYTELHSPGRPPKKVAYIYGVAVDKQAQGQGIGAELVRACMRYARMHGADICCTLPAEPSLYGWYAKSCGLVPVSFCALEEIPLSDGGAEIQELYADEYSYRRIDLLKGKPYISLYYDWLRFQEAIFKTYAGGFYAYKGGIACGYLDGDTLMIKEALNDAPEFIPALCRKLGAKKAVVRRARSEGQPYIAAFEENAYPPDTEWNLSLD